MGFSWWHFGALIANLITAIFFIIGIVGTERLWFEYKSEGVTFTSGNFGGCVKYTGCDTCAFWKDRNVNGSDSITEPTCHFYSTSEYKVPSKWSAGGYVAIIFCVIGLIVSLIATVFSGLMMFGLLRGMKGSVITMMAICVILSLLAWIVFIACVRTSDWVEPHPISGDDVNLSDKMGVKGSFILTALAAVSAIVAIVLTAFGPGKNQ